jgi:hypothetical protein
VRFIKLIIISLSLFIPQIISAAPPIVFEDMQHAYVLGKYLDILEDKEKQLTIEDILGTMSLMITRFSPTGTFSVRTDRRLRTSWLDALLIYL